jgi:CHAT domain-containing protein
MRWMVLAVATLAACGTAKQGPTVKKAKQPTDPTLGICGPQRPASKPFAAGLREAEDAIARGCYQEAAAFVGSSEPADKREATLMLLVATELRQAAVKISVLGEGRDRPVADLDGVWLHFDDQKPEDYALQVVGGALMTGVVPAEVRDSGRLLRLMLRGTSPTSCFIHDVDDDDRQAEAAARALRDERREQFAPVLLGEKTGGMTSAVALNEHWDCRTKDALGLHVTAAERFMEAGDETAALESRLDEAERGSFVGGWASDLQLPHDHRVRLKALAAEEEARRLGSGSFRKNGEQGLVLLEKVIAPYPKAAKLPGAAARIAYFRAVIKLRQIGDAAGARTDAHEAARLAVAAKRADLLDAARVVEMLASAELGDWKTAQELGATVMASFTQRGAYGARMRLLQQILALSDLLRQSGRLNDGVDLILLVARHVQGVPFLEMYHLIGGLEQLRVAGRFEEGLEVATVVSEAIRRLELPQDIREHQVQMFTTAMSYVTEFRTTLGDEEGAIKDFEQAGKDAPQYQLGVAARHGDTARMKGLLAAKYAPQQQFLVDATMVGDQMCHAVRDRIAPSLKLFVAGKGKLTDVVLPTAFSVGLTVNLATCAAILRRPDLIALARQLDELDGNAKPEKLEPYRLEAESKVLEAGPAYLAVAYRVADEMGYDPRGVVGTSQTLTPLFERAAISFLKAGNVGQALVALDEARARSLRVARAQAPAAADGPTGAAERKLAQAEEALRANLALQAGAGDLHVRSTLFKEQKRLEQARLEAQGERDAALRKLGERDNGSVRAAAMAPSLSVPEIQRRLRPDEVLVSYLIHPDEAWAIVISPKLAQAVKLPALDTAGMPVLSLALRRHGRLLGAARGDTRGMEEVGTEEVASADELALLRAELYARLVTPLESMIPTGRRVLVIPDAALADVPLSSIGPPGQPWITRNSLRFLPNASLLPETYRDKLTKPGAAAPVAVILGDARYDGQKWRPLPGTRREAESVARLLGTRPLLGAQATESRLVAAISTARIVHLATHGYADMRRPAYSALVLSAEGEEQDGLLHAYEIERLRLQAELVVLSACETGKGQARGAEGALALDRAFLVAGAGAVLSSLWVVSDAATDALMTAFYTGLGKGLPADVALARAMDVVRRRPGWEDPRFWSAFRLVGPGLR